MKYYFKQIMKIKIKKEKPHKKAALNNAIKQVNKSANLVEKSYRYTIYNFLNENYYFLI